MGSICSSSQVKCKDTESETSEGGSDIYETKNKDQDTNLLENELNETLNQHFGINELFHHQNCDESERIHKKNTCSKTYASTVFHTSPKKNKKIVLHILLSSKLEFNKQISIINQFVPNLSKHCRAKGFEMTVSLTYHGFLNHKNQLSAENNFTEDPFHFHEELENCFNEIKRHEDSIMIPILIFGSIFENLHIPIKIDRTDFNFLLSIISKEQRDLLQKFYKADIISKPFASYNLTSHSLHNEEIGEILDTFIMHMPINLKATYLTTEVEKIINVIIKKKKLSNHCIWIHSDSSFKSSTRRPLSFSEISCRQSELISKLRNTIPPKNIVPMLSLTNVEEIYFLLGDVLKSNIDSVMHEYFVKYNYSRNTIGMCKQIVEEIETVKKYSIAIEKNSISIYDIEGIIRYICSDSLLPLAIFGNNGEENNALASQVSNSLKDRFEDYLFVLRYSHLTVLSSEITSMLASIADEISLAVVGRPCQTHHNVFYYKRTIEQLLESTNFLIVIFLDSVDKIVWSNDFDWLPKILKPNLRIILTILSSDPLTENLSAKQLIKHGIPKENVLPLLRKTADTRGEENSISNNCLNSFEEKVSLKLLSLGVNVKYNNREELIECFFLKVESKLDVKFLEILLLIAAISPFGINETDFINIFEEQAEIERVFSLILWSKFCWLMGPMLIHTNNIRITDNAFKDAILKRYSKSLRQIQKTAKRYFENQPDTFFDVEKNLTRQNCSSGKTSFA